MPPHTPRLQKEVERLRLRLAEAEQTLEAIRSGEVDSLVVESPDGLRVYGLEGATNSYRVLMEAMNEGAATLTDDGVILYCNSRFAQMCGAPLQRVMGGSLREHVPERFQPTVEALIKTADEGESRGEVDLLTAVGEEIPAYLSINAIESQGRRILCMVATDLRTQKRSEELTQAELLARSVLEQAAEAIVVCDRTGRIVRASKAAADLCGCNPLLDAFDDMFPVVLCGQPAAPRGGLLAAVLGGESFHASPGTLTQRSGGQAHVLVSATALQGPDGQVLGCVITMTDVTESHRAEEALRESEERLRLALEGGNQGTWDWDLKGTFTLDDNGRSLFGLQPQEPATLDRFRSMLHPDDRERVIATLTAAPLPQMQIHEEYRITRGDGAIKWIVARGRVDESGVRMSGTVADITERKMAEEALHEADRRKNQFLAMLSHELRNPLTPIKNSLYILQRAEPGSDQSRRAREIIDRQVAQLSRLVDDLLDSTRIARNKIALRRETLELNDLVRGTVEDYRSLFDNSAIRLDVRSSAQPIHVLVDGARFAQVIGNLLQNAAKFTRAGGSTRVSVKMLPDERHVAVRVADTGEGIHPEMVSRLFEPFAQADRTLDRSKGGLGLGLALVKGLVEMHGGRVRAHSAGPGKGAEFVIVLPVETRSDVGAPLRRANR